MEVTSVSNVIPQIAGLFGISPIKRGKWTPKWLHRRRNRAQMTKAISGWKLDTRSEELWAKIHLAQELRDWAEVVMGQSNIDPEKSSIPRSKTVSFKTVQHFRYTPPKATLSKRVTLWRERRQRTKRLRKTLRDCERACEQACEKLEW